MDERVRRLSPEEKQRRLALRKKRKRIRIITNVIFLATTAICAVVFVFSLVTWLKYSIPSGNADNLIKEAKEAVATADAQITSVSTEKDTLQKEVDALLAELEKYNDD